MVSWDQYGMALGCVDYFMVAYHVPVGSVSGVSVVQIWCMT